MADSEGGRVFSPVTPGREGEQLSNRWQCLVSARTGGVFEISATCCSSWKTRTSWDNRQDSVALVPYAELC